MSFSDEEILEDIAAVARSGDRAVHYEDSLRVICPGRDYHRPDYYNDRYRLIRARGGEEYEAVLERARKNYWTPERSERARVRAHLAERIRERRARRR
jgi:hypothetical protein